MKRRFFKLVPVLLVPVIALGAAAGCKKEVEMGENSIADSEVYPEVAGPYAEEAAAAISAYKSGTLTAEEAAAQLYAYACYSTKYVDRYVFFSNKVSTSDYGSAANQVTNQEYKLIINGDKDTEGFKYHYSIGYVDSSSGLLAIFNGTFQNAKLRIVENTDILYRFNGSDIAYDEDDPSRLTCTWAIDSSDWGVPDTPIEKRAEKLTVEEIDEDIVYLAEYDKNNIVICGNINILVDGIVGSATIDETQLDGHTAYNVTMNIDTDVANADDCSTSMLINTNSPASSCTWTSYTITFTIWDNGLFQSYYLDEDWSGEVLGMSGDAESKTEVIFSYSSRDTATDEKLAKLQEAKDKAEGEEEEQSEEEQTTD